MTNRERRDRGLPYISDTEVFEEQKRARRLTQELNKDCQGTVWKIGKRICQSAVLL